MKQKEFLNIIDAINSIVFEKPSNNWTKLLNAFLDLKEVFTGKVYKIKIDDDKYEAVKLKNNAANKKSKLEKQNESLELDKEKKNWKKYRRKNKIKKAKIR